MEAAMHITCFGALLTVPFFPQIQIERGPLAGLYGYIRDVEGLFNTVFSMDGRMDVLFSDEFRVILPSHQQGQQPQDDIDGHADDQIADDHQEEGNTEVEQLKE
jgi:hypothetical protein